jgi:NADPH:quinone reductase-like Zn-dependent oxidoreductase
MGIVELPVRQFGLEAAGVISRVGSGVKEFKVGDRVACLKKQSFTTYFTVGEFACAKIPDELSFDEAACMLVPYTTAIHSLINVGRLEKGQVSDNL